MLKSARASASLLLFVFGLTPANAQPGGAVEIAFPFKENDRVAWVGSSSTGIGVWPKTMQYLLTTRHPELKLTFGRFTTGGGSFATGRQKMDEWLTPFKPNVVFFNYGSNDAGAGDKGIPEFRKNMEGAVAKARSFGARVYLITPQAADDRKAGAVPAARRTRYAEEMIEYGRDKNWPVVDVHHPLTELQAKGQKDDVAYTILTDNIHLTHPAYIAWGFYQYDLLNPPPRESWAGLDAAGNVTATRRCRISDNKKIDGGVSFTRADEILPLVPPQKLPPRAYVPLERLSQYMLQVTNLPDGDYAVSCEDKLLGKATAKALGVGVNLNTLVLDSGAEAPWTGLANELWDGKNLDRIGQTRWRFEVLMAK